MIDKSFHSAGMTFPARLILGVDQFFKVERYNSELYRLAYRQARKQAVTEGLQGAELSAHVARSQIALRSDPALRAAAYWIVSMVSWDTPSARLESTAERTGIRKIFGATEEERLLNASHWRSVSAIPNLPFASFGEMLKGIADGRCYISVDESTAFRFTNLTSTRAAQAFDRFLSWTPFLVALASVIAAIASKNFWMLIGIPAAVIAFVVGASPISLVRPILLTAKDAFPLPLKLAVGMLLVLFSPVVGAFLGPILFAWMLFTDRPAAAWIVASYILSVHAMRVFRARGAIALHFAAKRSEAFFLFALSHGLCALRDKTTGDFLRRPERE
jgi:hypothetical protein